MRLVRMIGIRASMPLVVAAAIGALPAAASARPSGATAVMQTAGAAAHLAIDLDPNRYFTTDLSWSYVWMTVTDADGNPVAGESITLDSPLETGAVTDEGDGTYWAEVTAPAHAGTYPITAHDGDLSAQTAWIEDPGPASTITLTLAPASLPADGMSQTTATATVTDTRGDPVTEGSVDVTAFGAQPGPVTAHGDGTWTLPITAGFRSRSVTVRATYDPGDGNTLEATQPLVLTPWQPPVPPARPVVVPGPGGAGAQIDPSTFRATRVTASRTGVLDVHVDVPATGWVEAFASEPRRPGARGRTRLGHRLLRVHAGADDFRVWPTHGGRATLLRRLRARRATVVTVDLTYGSYAAFQQPPVARTIRVRIAPPHRSRRR